MCINVTLCLFPCNKNNSLPTSLGHHIFFLTEQVSSSKGLGVLSKGASKSLGLVLKMTFCHSYRTRNILTIFCSKCPTFGRAYRPRNILTKFCSKSPTSGHSYRTRNILTIFIHKFVEKLLNASAERL